MPYKWLSYIYKAHNIGEKLDVFMFCLYGKLHSFLTAEHR